MIPQQWPIAARVEAHSAPHFGHGRGFLGRPPALVSRAACILRAVDLESLRIIGCYSDKWIPFRPNPSYALIPALRSRLRLVAFASLRVLVHVFPGVLRAVIAGLGAGVQDPEWELPITGAIDRSADHEHGLSEIASCVVSCQDSRLPGLLEGDRDSHLVQSPCDKSTLGLDSGAAFSLRCFLFCDRFRGAQGFQFGPACHPAAGTLRVVCVAYMLSFVCAHVNTIAVCTNNSKGKRYLVPTETYLRPPSGRGAERKGVSS